MSAKSKIMSMSEAITRYVRPGMMICLGAGLEAAVPFAAGQEIIRRRIDGLRLVGPISDALFDMMVGGGVVAEIRAAWVGNVTTGQGYYYKRAVETGTPRPIKVVSHSNLSVAAALDAGAMGVTYGLVRSLFGTDILRENEDLCEVACPFSGQKQLAVKAIRPDITIIHAQRADNAGNTHLWGNLGLVPQAVAAAGPA